jgi:hypothetical protein
MKFQSIQQNKNKKFTPKFDKSWDVTDYHP